MNPLWGVTDAVTEPLAIKFDKSASGVNAALGILNNPAPLPVNIEADTLFLTTKLVSISTEPVNSDPLIGDSTLNPKLGETDAVTLPLPINGDNNASGVNAALGILNKLAPLPENDEPLFIEIPPLTNNEPVNCEPLAMDSTLNPNCGETDAVTLPLLINGETNASGVNAAFGILNNPAPLPLNIDAVTLPAIYTDELNSALFVPSNLNP